MDVESVVECGQPRPEGSWTRLCVRVGIDTAILNGDRAAKDEAILAAWHVNKATDLPTRVRWLARGRYAVEAQIPAPSPWCENVLREVV